MFDEVSSGRVRKPSLAVLQGAKVERIYSFDELLFESRIDIDVFAPYA